MTNKVVKINQSDDFGRELFYLFLDKFSDFPLEIKFPSESFALFIACNSDAIHIEEIGNWADRMIDIGVASMAAWGEGCERMHDIFDEVLVEREVSDQKSYPHVMTTWHANDTIDEALWYALNNTISDDDFGDTCGSNLIVAVGNKDWDVQLRERLSNVERFSKEFLENNP